MMKYFAGILLVMLSLAACGGVEPLQITQSFAPSTSIPTQTRTLTTVPTEKVIPATSTSTAAQIPLISTLRLTHDLIWFESSGEKDGHLVRWNASSNEIEILAGEDPESLIVMPGKITDFDLKMKAILVTLEIENDGNLFYELGSIDLDNEQYLPFFATPSSSSSEVEIVDIALSPNGRWAAYVLTYRSARQYLKDELYVFQTASNPSPVLFGVCEPEFGPICIHSLIWSVDNSMLAWHGPEGGIWVGRLQEGSRLALPNDIGRDVMWDDVRYYADSWAPNDAYIEVVGYGWDSVSRFLFDLNSEDFISLHEFYAHSNMYFLETAWLPNNQLVIVESIYRAPDQVVSVQIFSILKDPDSQQGSLEIEHRYELDSDETDRFFQDGQDDLQVFEFMRLRIIEETTILLNVISYNTKTDELIELNRFSMESPEEIFRIDGLLLGTQNNQSFLFVWDDPVIYMSSDGQYAADIRDLVGEHACCFAWVDS